MSCAPMQESGVFWLRVAAGLYALGLGHAILTLLKRRTVWFRPALAAFVVGVILHLVSLVELARAGGELPLANFYQSMSLCAFLIALVFLFVWWRYQFAPLSIFVFPLVFLMTLVGATQLPVAGWTSPRVREGWLMVHVISALSGYTALLLTAMASIFYLVRERQLKRKQPGSWFERLPPLGTLDQIVTKSLTLGFVFITAGVVAGLTWAFVESGTRWVRDVRIHVALITWALCLVTVFLRNAAGWRGRRAALLSIGLVGCAALTWVTHIGLRGLLLER
ncbi:MAG: cytochrome c biogenesis protein [Bryobacteraceae bacterium]|nr:cytochrome c biogenesis protein [Bryobacteraceae bacterium]MDW8380383.1 cytochrome c biogenesis protein CcsA [Bryobacterales bacterium]